MRGLSDRIELENWFAGLSRFRGVLDTFQFGKTRLNPVKTSKPSWASLDTFIIIDPATAKSEPLCMWELIELNRFAAL